MSPEQHTAGCGHAQGNSHGHKGGTGVCVRVRVRVCPHSRTESALVSCPSHCVLSTPQECLGRVVATAVRVCAPSACRYPSSDHERPHAPPAPGGTAGWQGLHGGDAHSEGLGDRGVL